MKLKCLKQKDGVIGLNGRTWPVKNGQADVPDDVGARLCRVLPDEFVPAEPGAGRKESDA